MEDLLESPQSLSEHVFAIHIARLCGGASLDRELSNPSVCLLAFLKNTCSDRSTVRERFSDICVCS